MESCFATSDTLSKNEEGEEILTSSEETTFTADFELKMFPLCPRVKREAALFPARAHQLNKKLFIALIWAQRAALSVFALSRLQSGWRWSNVNRRISPTC